MGEREQKRNLKRCSSGHFYDADQFDVCPYCSPREEDSAETVLLGCDPDVFREPGGRDL